MDKVTLQPKDLVKRLVLKDEEEGVKAMNLFASFLAYMEPGDVLQTSLIDFVKIDTELMQIKTKIDEVEILDALHKNKLIRIPL
jgi:hypothetical protein